MNKLTLVIPAKKEKDTLPKVLEDLKRFHLKIIVVLRHEDTETINAIKNYKVAEQERITAIIEAKNNEATS